MENINHSSNAFLKKIKKQAKNLLKLAQQQNSHLQINNLASAQEILAQVNGYPHWHALELTINNSFNDNKDCIITENNNELKYINKNKKVTSFFNIIKIPFDDVSNFILYIESLKEKCAFQFNMGFHEIKLIISHHKMNVEKKEYNFSFLSQSLGIKESLVKKLFTFNTSLTTNKTSDISALLVISTQEEMLSEHLNFCENFKNDDTYHEVQYLLSNSLTTDQKSILEQDPEKLKQRIIINDEFSFSLNNIMSIRTVSKNSDNLHKAWIHSISMLSKRGFDWDIEVSLNSKEFSFYQHSNNLNNEIYLGGLYKSLNIDNNVSNPEMFSFNDKSKNSLPWKTGIPFINHSDNELSFYQPASGQQTIHNTLLFGQPGSGKSSILNLINLFSIQENLKDIPYLGVVDIGTASKPIFQFLKKILPNEQKNIVNYFEFKMTRDYSINVFDTQLGCRFPTHEETSLILNFMLLLISENKQIHQTPSSDLIINIISDVINDMYYQTSEQGNPNLYGDNINLQIDECLQKLKFKSSKNTSWWNVVDFLFESGYEKEAVIAQRYAVPLLSNSLQSLKNKSIINNYSQTIVNTNENIIQYLKRIIQNILNQYTIFNEPTIFDISESKINLFNLENIVKSGGKISEKQTATIYLITNYIINRNYKKYPVTEKFYFLGDSHSSIIPVDKYQEFHKNKRNKTLRNKKIICLDEFHRVSPLISQYITNDMRESYIFNIEMILSTQSLDCITDTMKDLISTYLLLDIYSQNQRKYTFESLGIFGFEELSKIDNFNKYKKNNLLTLFAKFITKDGSFNKIISFHPSPYLLTLMNNSIEDDMMKERLLNKFDLEKTLDILLKEFPKGVKYKIEEFSYPYSNNLIDILFEEILLKYS